MPRKGGVPANLKPMKAGETINPSGRPKGYKDFNRLCRENAPAAMEKLQELLNCGHPPTELGAARDMLDRAWGKPTQHVADETERQQLAVGLIVVDPIEAAKAYQRMMRKGITIDG